LRVLLTFWSGWSQTKILLTSTSLVAGITAWPTMTCQKYCFNEKLIPIPILARHRPRKAYLKK
jgi:hypothetical protein